MTCSAPIFKLLNFTYNRYVALIFNNNKRIVNDGFMQNPLNILACALFKPKLLVESITERAQARYFESPINTTFRNAFQLYGIRNDERVGSLSLVVASN